MNALKTYQRSIKRRPSTAKFMVVATTLQEIDEAEDNRSSFGSEKSQEAKAQNVDAEPVKLGEVDSTNTAIHSSEDKVNGCMCWCSFFYLPCHFHLHSFLLLLLSL